MTHQPAANTEALLDISGAWQLTALTGQPISLNNTKKTVGLTIDLNNNKMSGFSGCNHFFSSIEINQQKIMIGTIAATMMLCDKEMALEQQYLNALSTTSHYSAQQSQLVLYDNANRPLATFHRQTSKR